MTAPIFKIDNSLPRKRHPALVFSMIAVLLILAAVVKVLYSPANPNDQYGIIEIRVDDLSGLIRHAEGKPVLMLFYSSQYPRCSEIFPELVQLQAYYMHQVNFLFISLDETDKKLDVFLRQFTPNVQPYRLSPWKPGELTDAMRRINVDLENSISLPYVLLFNAKGETIRQWSNQIEIPILRENIDQTLQ